MRYLFLLYTTFFFCFCSENGNKNVEVDNAKASVFSVSKNLDSMKTEISKAEEDTNLMETKKPVLLKKQINKVILEKLKQYIHNKIRSKDLESEEDNAFEIIMTESELLKYNWNLFIIKGEFFPRLFTKVCQSKNHK